MTQTFQELITFLDNNPGTHTYLAVSEALFGHNAGGNAVGSMLRAIHGRDLHQYCVRVVKDPNDPTSHGCSLHGGTNQQ